MKGKVVLIKGAGLLCLCILRVLLYCSPYGTNIKRVTAGFASKGDGYCVSIIRILAIYPWGGYILHLHDP